MAQPCPDGPDLTIYRLLLSVVFPLLLGRLVLRVLRGKEGLRDLGERLGGGQAAGGRAVWLHGASNGELASVRPLAEALLRADPGLALLITANTLTGRDFARSWGHERVRVALAPLDHRLAVARFLRRHDPQALLIVENELWPNRIEMAAARGLPVIVLGARMSQSSARNWARLAGLARRLMERIGALSAQDAASEERFVSLGLDRARLLPRTNLKTAYAAAPPDTAFPGLPRARTILAASTHEGEEEVVLRAFALARAARPDLRLILAPRHPRRARQIGAEIRAAGFSFGQRSTGDAPGDAPVYLADTMGEMANWYAAAGVCFVGGSLAPRGGHTPFEPAAYGAAILHGPDVSNFAPVYAALDAAGGAQEVRDAESLARALDALSDPQAQARMAEAARVALSSLSQDADQGSLVQAVLALLAGGAPRP